MSRSGFTLLEMIVVVVILSIMVTMITPRLLEPRGRALRLAAEQVADLLAMFTSREAISGRPVGIWHDAERNWIVLVILDTDAARLDEPADWRPDPAVAPIKLPPSIAVDRGVLAIADGRPVDIQQWPIASEPGRPRPRLEVILASDDGQSETVVLPAHAVAPYMLSDARAASLEREPIDLDATGRWREDW